MQLSGSTELEILASIQQGDNPLDDSVLAQVKPEYFQVSAYKWLVTQLQKRSWQHIPQGHLEQLLLTVQDEAKRGQYTVQLNNLFSHKIEFKDDASKSFKEYLAFCTLNAALVGSSEGYKSSQRIDFFMRDLQTGIDSAAQIISGDKFKAVDYVGSFDDRFDQRKQERDNPAIAPRILTGIPGLDLQFNIRGPLIVNFLAPFKRYKSIFLNSLGFAALLQGFNVLHVTLENDKRLTNARYDTMFSLLTYDRIEGALLTQEELDKLRQLFAWMDTWENRLKVVKGTAYTTTSKDILSECERLHTTEGFVPDVIIVDYMNVLAANVKEREERHEQNKIVWDLKLVGERYNCPIITASQATREAADAERITQGQQGKSVGISQAVDLTIAINQTPQEKASGIIILSPMFSRIGPITIPEMVLESDLSRMLVSRTLPDLWQKALELNPYVPEQENE